MITGFNQLLSNLYVQPLLYILCLCGCAFVYCFFLKKHFLDIFDPIIYMLLGSIFATGVVVFMSVRNIVPRFDIYNLSYFFSELAFILGMAIYPKKKIQRINNMQFKFQYNNRYDFSLDLLFYCLLFCLLLFESIIIVRTGTASDYANHVAFTASAGIFGELSDGLLTVLLFLCWYRYYKKKYISSTVVLVLITVLLLSSGSKSALLKLGFTLFYFELFIMRKELRKVSFTKYYGLFLILAVLGMMFIVASNERTYNLHSICESILNRFIAFGDTFAFIYTNDNYILNIILKNNNINNCLIEPVKRLLFIGIDSNHESVGNQIMTIASGSLVASGGVNTRHNLFFLICFGPFLCCAMSYLLGRLVIFVTRDVFYSKRMDLFRFMTFILIYEAVLSAVTDPGLFIIALFRRLPGMMILLMSIKVLVLLSSRRRLYS